MLGPNAGLDVALNHAGYGRPEVGQLIDVARVGQYCAREATRLLAAVLGGAVEHGLDLGIFEEPCVHGRRNSETVFLEGGSRRLNDLHGVG
jgi:hypothetical protein